MWMGSQRPPRSFLPLVNPPAAELVPETPQQGPSSPFWPAVTQETAVTEDPPGQALLSRDCASETRKVSSWMFSDPVFVLWPAVAAGNKTCIYQNWGKHEAERTVFW